MEPIGKNPPGMSPLQPAGENADKKTSPDSKSSLLTTPEPQGYRGPASGLLGPDGEAARLEKDSEGILKSAREKGREIGSRAEETWSDATSGIGQFVQSEPMTAALTSLGIGVVVGVILGVIIARD
ncbi:MAG: hypothetical protein ABJC07_08905 [Acidobacteriota bacterium]